MWHPGTYLVCVQAQMQPCLSNTHTTLPCILTHHHNVYCTHTHTCTHTHSLLRVPLCFSCPLHNCSLLLLCLLRYDDVGVHAALHACCYTYMLVFVHVFLWHPPCHTPPPPPPPRTHTQGKPYVYPLHQNTALVVTMLVQLSVVFLWTLGSQQGWFARVLANLVPLPFTYRLQLLLCMLCMLCTVLLSVAGITRWAQHGEVRGRDVQHTSRVVRWWGWVRGCVGGWVGGCVARVRGGGRVGAAGS